MKINVNLLTLPIDKIRPNPWNPNKQSDFIFEKEVTSIKDHGFIDPILVREKNGYYEIIDGEHRWRGAQKAGLEEVSVNNLGEVEDHVAQRLTIIMNEVKGEADATKLGELLRTINLEVDIDELERSLPYNLDELNHLINTSKIDWDTVNPNLDAKEEEEEEEKEDSGLTTFQVKLKTEIHDVLMNHLNRIKLSLASGGDPSDVSTGDAMEYLIRHITSLPEPIS